MLSNLIICSIVGMYCGHLYANSYIYKFHYNENYTHMNAVQYKKSLWWCPEPARDFLKFHKDDDINCDR